MKTGASARNTIGVLAGWQVYGGILDSFLGQVLDGIRAAARANDCNLLLACGVGSARGSHIGGSAWPVPLPEADFIPVGPWNADGLVVICPLFSEAASAYIQGLIAQGYPIVFGGSGEAGPSVTVDNEGGIRQAMAHLAQHGHRRVAFIGCDQGGLMGDAAIRLRTYHNSLSLLGMERDPRLVAVGSHTVEGGRQAAAEILDRAVPFTALLSSNDAMAEGAIEALREAGLRVPQDVAVIGFDDRLEARAHMPPLTTVHHPTFELGYQAARLLLKFLQGEATPVETMPIPTRLVIRRTCGCAPGASLSRNATCSSDGQVATASSPQGTCPREGLRVIGGREADAGALLPPAVEARMLDVISGEALRLTQREMERLCHSVIQGFADSLRLGDPAPFDCALEEVLDCTSRAGQDLHIWQVGMASLGEWCAAQLDAWPFALVAQEVSAMLDGARLTISEAARGQHTRQLLRQAETAEQVGQMAARLLVAQDEEDVFETLAQNIRAVGIEQATVALYEPQGDDPVAWSALRLPEPLDSNAQRFVTRHFPPKGLYPENEAFSLALLPLYIQDEPTGFVALDAGHLEPCADIVRQLAAALRSVRLYREALEGRRLAEEANRLKSRFLSIVSHELRMPLNVISGLTDILLQEGLASGSERCTVGREDLERIYASAQHLDSLICDVLDLTRSEMGRLELECEPLDLSEPLRAVAAMGQLLAEDKGLGFRAEIADSLPSVWGDPARLRQVALNLVSNAIKFTDQGQVTLAATATGGQVRVTVQDTGLGIPPEEQVAIFDEFRQSERTAALGYGGLGLGLAICRRLVELHGGGIGVESSGKEGDGSTFYFTLPTLADAPKASPTASTCQGQSVLLLAEELEGGKTLADHLTSHGFQVEMQHLDECPEDWAGLLENPPAAVILDRTLASKQGWQIIESLKGNPATSGVQVLFYSLKDEEDIGSLLQVDCTAAPMQAAALERILVGRKPTDDNEPNRIPNSLLLVDDDPDTLETQSRIIKAGYPDCRLSLARDGRDALAQMRQDRPDLVLLDLMMPELDGFQVLEAMRQDERCRNTPVIVFTGRTLTEEDMRRLNHGVSSILQKGIFTVEETLQHIRAALSARERLADERRGTVRKALAYLHEHYAEQLSRGDIARFAGVSERHLSRCFRQEMGVTLVTYLRRYRVKQARELLDARDKNVTEVAMASGFSSSSYFARVFRQEVGMPPSAYLVNRR